MLPIYKPQHEIPRFVLSLCRNFKQHRVIPETLRLHKIYPMLGAVGFTFDGVKLERNHGIENIPYLLKKDQSTWV